MNIIESIQQINNAISAIETGAQEYTINNRKYVRADLSVLYTERRQLQNQLNNGNTTYFIRFEGR